MAQQLTLAEHAAYRAAAARAATILHRAVLNGTIPNLKLSEISCTDCSKRATVYDHRDYDKPLDVDPVCYGCNSKRGAAKWGNKEPIRIRLYRPKLKSVVHNADASARSDGGTDSQVIFADSAVASGQRNERQCLRCGELFIPRIKSQVYCCQHCKNASAQHRWRERQMQVLTVK